MSISYSNSCRCGSTTHRYPSHHDCELKSNTPRKRNHCKCGSIEHNRTSSLKCKLNPRVNIQIYNFIILLNLFALKKYVPTNNVQVLTINSNAAISTPNGHVNYNLNPQTSSSFNRNYSNSTPEYNNMYSNQSTPSNNFNNAYQMSFNSSNNSSNLYNNNNYTNI
jgi:hypothetical protein